VDPAFLAGMVIVVAALVIHVTLVVVSRGIVERTHRRRGERGG
jgi:hypothetical protein